MRLAPVLAMPRRPRHHTVVEGYPVLKTWRGHNKEWNIHQASDRGQYFHYLFQELSKQTNRLNGYVLMANHTHEVYRVTERTSFSNLMRNHHARYGAYFNRTRDRCGKVAQDRPHTALILSDESAMQVMFYVLANPVRAGLVKDPRHYRYSSYSFLAFGDRRGALGPVLEYPDWYLNLGATPDLRQRRFRRLFACYLREKGLVKERYSKSPFLGPALLVLQREQEVKAFKHRNPGPSPPN